MLRNQWSLSWWNSPRLLKAGWRAATGWLRLEWKECDATTPSPTATPLLNEEGMIPTALVIRVGAGLAPGRGFARGGDKFPTECRTTLVSTPQKK